jgi:hypothetical protein
MLILKICVAALWLYLAIKACATPHNKGNMAKVDT